MAVLNADPILKAGEVTIDESDGSKVHVRTWWLAYVGSTPVLVNVESASVAVNAMDTFWTTGLPPVVEDTFDTLGYTYPA